MRIALCIGGNKTIGENVTRVANFGLMGGLMAKISALSAVCRGLLRKYT